VVKILYRIVANKRKDMRAFYKTVMMSYLLKNGDAHLKNFGVFYDGDMDNIRYSPAYDIVNIAVYVFTDRPALSLLGKKLWFPRKQLIKFAVDNCYISEKNANIFYDECVETVKYFVVELRQYIAKNPAFKSIGSRMIGNGSNL